MSLTVIIVIVVAGLAMWLFLKWFDRRNSVRVFGPWDEARELERKDPYLRREVVEAKVKSLFPSHDPAEILQLLDDDIPSFWGLERMQLNILKLSDGDLDKLRYYIGLAKSGGDFMKVVDLAEYPEGSRIDVRGIDKLPYDEHRRIADRDLRQYLDWLKRK